MCRPRTLHRRPEEKRWEDVLSFVVGLPWKLSKAHDGDAEALDENPQLPSSDPEVSPLPPIVTEEPIKKIRGFHVYPRDVDPSLQGFGFTPDCDGCKATINGKRSVTHSLTCRLRVMEQAPNNANIAARVKKSLAKEVEHHSKS